MVHKWLGYAYLVSLIISCVIGLLKYQSLTGRLRIISILLVATALNESIALYAGRKFHNNMPVYSVFSLIQYALIIWFFSRSLSVFRRAGRLEGVIFAGLLFWLLDVVFWQPLKESNTYFLAYEGICIIVLVMLGIPSYVSLENRSIAQVAGFRVSLLLGFYGVGTFFLWAAIDLANQGDERLLQSLSVIILLINITTYFGIGLVLFRFPKFQPDR